MEKDDLFTITARRCKRCGGLLTSAQGIRDGYGPCCLKKIQEECHMDVMGVCVDKAGGLLIRIYDKERLARSLAHYDLARKIKEVDS